ncbi:WD40 repeat [Paramuricea clavata]|uniref:WD40 repeat n=1 Tax=Paramuricea clavata TaxID=317549 RepID=A0A7D9IG57_PARCT|nr:WD40 repeat [Paramuricea clavata]
MSESSLSLEKETHYKKTLISLATWNFFVDDCRDSESWDDEFERSGFKGSRQITAIENDYWLYADVRNLFVFRTAVTTCSTRVLWSSFSPDGSRLATCTSNGYINIWNVNTGQTEQSFKTNQEKSILACWWSEKFLFVFNFWDSIASLWKYPVDVHLKILFSQSQQVSLRHLVDEFVSLSVVVDFSEGYLRYQCGETKPAKVLDVNRVREPRMVTLPGIKPMMNITVSPGASFLFGAAKLMFYIWKRSAMETIVYDVFLFINQVQ